MPRSASCSATAVMKGWVMPAPAPWASTYPARTAPGMHSSPDTAWPSARGMAISCTTALVMRTTAWPSLAEQCRNRDRRPRQQLRLEDRRTSGRRHRGVVIAARPPADFDLIGRKVHNPEFRNAITRIERSLHRAIIGQTVISDLDDQQHLVGARRSQAIVVGPRLEHGEIRLRLGEVIELHRVLHCP